MKVSGWVNQWKWEDEQSQENCVDGDIFYSCIKQNSEDDVEANKNYQPSNCPDQTTYDLRW